MESCQDSRIPPTLVRLLLSYDGSSFAGWQVQPHAITVQGTIEQALAKPLRGHHPIIGASRTDRGVHARGQVAHFTTQSIIQPRQLCGSLNRLLPPSIRCLGIACAETGFHSQLSARRKSYLYTVQLGPIHHPLLRSTIAHWPYPFQMTAFREAALCFLGTHDFSALANENQRGQAARGAVRTIETIDVRQQGDLIEVEFVGNGFLYKQVRNMMGAMLAAARGSCTPSQIASWMLAKDRRALPPPAPAQGLCLQWIDYGTPLSWESWNPSTVIEPVSSV